MPEFKLSSNNRFWCQGLGHPLGKCPGFMALSAGSSMISPFISPPNFSHGWGTQVCFPFQCSSSENSMVPLQFAGTQDLYFIRLFCQGEAALKATPHIPALVRGGRNIHQLMISAGSEPFQCLPPRLSKHPSVSHREPDAAHLSLRQVHQLLSRIERAKLHPLASPKSNGGACLKAQGAHAPFSGQADTLPDSNSALIGFSVCLFS